ncbi:MULTISPECIES: hypothetical protein [unclassified Microcoleus]|uniref:hypothetical protein n=1 Tax=unclassified Microcoleus TaxID=2642155 RepID=UPI002FCFCEF3
MLISDLSYLKNISENELILGGAALGLDAFAVVDSGNTLTATDIIFRNKGKVTKATGTGTAIAIGTNPLADVDVYYSGFDKVQVKIKSGSGANYAFETVTVKAMDLPH